MPGVLWIGTGKYGLRRLTPNKTDSVGRQNLSSNLRRKVKQPFIAIHDYQHGAVIVRIFATDADEVAKVLRPPTWKVYEESDPTCPDVHGVRLLESDVDDKADWLQKQIYMQDRRAEGKRGFIVRDNRSVPPQHREVWARSESEIRSSYPTLEVVWHEPITKKMSDSMGTSDIGINDAFLQQRRRDA